MVGMADFFTPAIKSDIELADPNSRLVFWKQILPRKGIHYTAKDGSRQFLNFDDEYLADLAKMDAVDAVGFLLADGKNSHDVGPENWRGKILKMEVRTGHEDPNEDGLYGKVAFPNAAAALAVQNNPELGVSARIRENIPKSDGTVIKRGIIHVLGTMDPQIEGMKAWEKADADLSKVEDNLDLSNEEYEDATMADKKKVLKDYTSAELKAMPEEELDSLLAEFFASDDGTLVNTEDKPDEDDADKDESDEEESEDEDDTEDEKPKGELVGAGADMSKEMQDSIDLANSRASFAEQTAREMRAELNLSKWEKERDAYLAAGVPAHVLDLAAPILSQGSECVIDLSNGEADGSDVDVAGAFRGMLDAMKGYVDLSNEAGHGGTASLTDTDSYDERLLAEWKI
jgi:hypothetical protein